MRKKLEWQWEEIFNFHQPSLGTTQTARAKVMGGWVVRNTMVSVKGHMCESMVFVADRDHEWFVTQPVEAQKPQVVASDFESKKA